MDTQRSPRLSSRRSRLPQEQELPSLVDPIKLRNLERMGLNVDQPRPLTKQLRDISDPRRLPRARLIARLDEQARIVGLVDLGDRGQRPARNVIRQDAS